VFILKGVKVLCFDTLLQVLILKEMEEVNGRGRRWGKPAHECDATNMRKDSMGVRIG
jgi:hypothetical protein